jgi:nitroreductase
MILDLLQKRYSCREFSDKPIPSEIIHYILECGRLSASGGNEQPWKFGVITKPDIIKEISIAASVNYCQKWITSAPLVIVLCTELFDYDIADIGLKRFPSMIDRMVKIDKDLLSAIGMEEHQTKIPGEHMVLAALEHGIYSTWISSIDCEMVGKLLGVNGYLVSNVIAFGYPIASSNTTPKKDLHSITFTNHFDNIGYTGTAEDK